MHEQKGFVMCLILHKLGHPLQPAPIHCVNLTAMEIANNTVLDIFKYAGILARKIWPIITEIIMQSPIITI